MSDYECIQETLIALRDKLSGESFREKLNSEQPCVGCSFCVRCRDEELACEEFVRWVNADRPRIHRARSQPRVPTEKWFKTINRTSVMPKMEHKGWGSDELRQNNA